MADTIIAKSTGGKTFAPHPAGTFAVTCVDVIDLGENVESYQGAPEKITHKCALIFSSGELDDEGKPFEIKSEFTVSMFNTAALRKFLGSWRGKPYTDEEAEAGAPLHKLEGVSAFASVIHKTAVGTGRVYAKIDSIMPLPKGTPKPVLPAYTRAEYWGEKRAEYAAAVAKYRGTRQMQGFDEKPAALNDDADDDLPF